MKLGLTITIASIVLLSSCSSTPEEKEQKANTRTAKNDAIKYGGTLHLAKDETFSSIFPTGVLDLQSSELANQIHDGLLEYNPVDFSLNPAVAKDWEVNSDGTIYTFKLREDVYFHNNECFEGGIGRKVTANDVKFSFELLASKEFENNFDIVLKPYLKGAEAFFKGEADEISGLKVLDDQTVTFELIQPSSTFAYMLAMPNTSIIAKEAYDKYGSEMTVGCGPFKYIEPADITKELFLVFNENYYQEDEYGHPLPYIDSIHYKFISSKQKQLDKFYNNELTMIDGLSSSIVSEVVFDKQEDFSSQPPKTMLVRSSDLSTQYYSFTCFKAPFDDVRVRKAFSHAIDRTKIVNDVLDGRGTPGLFGITPKINAFANYDFNAVGGYDLDIETAQQLLAEAGYPNGEGFPQVSLEINLGGSIHKRVASEIERQLKQNLGVSVSIDQVSFKKKIENSMYGYSNMYRGAWIADYPDPESFLSILQGTNVPEDQSKPSYPNVMRYKNAQFDSLYLEGVKTIDKDKRYQLFAKAEAEMLKDAPIMILWYDENYSIYNSSLHNWTGNGLKIADFTRVFLNEMTMDEYKKIHSLDGSGQ